MLKDFIGILQKRIKPPLRLSLIPTRHGEALIRLNEAIDQFYGDNPMDISQANEYCEVAHLCADSLTCICLDPEAPVK